MHTEERLLRASPDVLDLFAKNPFPEAPPQRVRTILWQYWFTDLETKRETGAWWRRQQLGPYSPGLQRAPNGQVVVSEMSDNNKEAPHPTER